MPTPTPTSTASSLPPSGLDAEQHIVDCESGGDRGNGGYGYGYEGFLNSTFY